MRLVGSVDSVYYKQLDVYKKQDDWHVERVESLAESGLVGDPDEIQRLWTPHRMVYIADTHQPDEHDCPFCHAPTLEDEQSLIVYRGKTSYALLNLSLIHI